MTDEQGKNRPVDEAAIEGIVAHWRRLGCGGPGRAAMDVMDDEDAPYMAQEAVEVLLREGWQPPALASSPGMQAQAGHYMRSGR